jgi:hypothetical protein
MCTTEIRRKSIILQYADILQRILVIVHIDKQVYVEYNKYKERATDLQLTTLWQFRKGLLR